MISIGVSLTQVKKAATGAASSDDTPTSTKMCGLNSLALSTSVVISVMICALLEKIPSSSFSELSDAVSVMFFSLALFSDGPEDEATSFLTSVLAKRIEFSCTRMPACSVVVERNHVCPLTNAHYDQFRGGRKTERIHTQMAGRSSDEHAERIKPSPAPIMPFGIRFKVFD